MVLVLTLILYGLREIISSVLTREHKLLLLKRLQVIINPLQVDYKLDLQVLLRLLLLRQMMNGRLKYLAGVK